MQEFGDKIIELVRLFAALLIVTLLTIFLISVIVTITKAICNWILFSKAGKPSWAAIVPIYNKFVQSKISFGDYRWAVIWLVAYVPYRAVMLLVGLVDSLGDSHTASTIGMVLALIGMTIGIVVAVVNGINMYFYAKSFGKSTPFCVLSVFFSPICLLIMACDTKTQYVGCSDFGKKKPKVK